MLMIMISADVEGLHHNLGDDGGGGGGDEDDDYNYV